ncbi:hypothetical protein [Niastella sp. OAS944]|uniref:hypothetical protein n=1 Tax=Niastella sp. OAS944 TaxID=2664089 RepID=UPI003480ABFD|nr:hypothetical protein [Chitinophagaceae bacterium OAS944]
MNRYIKFVAIILVIASVGCKKDDYLTDGGLAKAVTPLSNYDYLANHRYHYFDTVVLIIDHFNLKDSVNKAGTFFAFTDFSVTALMNSLQVTTLNDLFSKVTSKLVTQYLFSDAGITLDNASEAAKQYANWAAADSALSAVKKIENTYTINLVNSAPAYSYYTLQYVKINGVLDDSPNMPPGDVVDVSIPCQTTGVKTSNGATTLHVLANTATLNKL